MKKNFEHDRMVSGKLYVAARGPELAEGNARKYRILNAIRALPLGDPGRQKLYAELFYAWGEGSYVESPFYCDYGANISVGKNFYANAGCVFLDPAPITIGDNVFLGPSVGIYTPFHPIVADVRDQQLEGAKAVTIGSHVWIGGSAVLCPGVTIGSNVVIGAGSVVTKDIPDNSVAVGNPCHVLRPITQKDEDYWHQQAAEYEAARQQALD